MDASGSHLRRLAFNAAHDAEPKWSPGGPASSSMSERDKTDATPVQSGSAVGR
jgi:hypothetical protein